MDQMTSVLLTAGDLNLAMTTSLRAMTVTAQVHGLDSQESLQHHVELAILYLELKDYSSSLQHLLTAKYLISLLGGEKHPELATIYKHIALLCKQIDQVEMALECYRLARGCVYDLTKHASLTENLAEACLKLGKLDEVRQF